MASCWARPCLASAHGVVLGAQILAQLIVMVERLHPGRRVLVLNALFLRTGKLDHALTARVEDLSIGLPSPAPLLRSNKTVRWLRMVTCCSQPTSPMAPSDGRRRHPRHRRIVANRYAMGCFRGRPVGRPQHRTISPNAGSASRRRRLTSCLARTASVHRRAAQCHARGRPGRMDADRGALEDSRCVADRHVRAPSRCAAVASRPGRGTASWRCSDIGPGGRQR
jgi:hypothetical protein